MTTASWLSVYMLVLVWLPAPHGRPRVTTGCSEDPCGMGWCKKGEHCGPVQSIGDCGAGQYGHKEISGFIDWNSPDIYCRKGTVGCEIRTVYGCIDCRSGTVGCTESSYLGLVPSDCTEDEDCYSCMGNTVSNDDRTECITCSGDAYPSDDHGECLGCPSGQEWHGNRCQECSNGHASSGELAECRQCTSGTVPNDDQSECVTCGDGTIATDDHTACTACTGGTTPNDDHSECVTCGDGTIATDDHATCTACADGTAPNDDHSECITCGDGTIAGDDHTACIACTGDTVPNSEQTECVECEEDTVPNVEHTECIVVDKYAFLKSQAPTMIAVVTVYALMIIVTACWCKYRQRDTWSYDPMIAESTVLAVKSSKIWRKCCKRFVQPYRWSTPVVWGMDIVDYVLFVLWYVFGTTSEEKVADVAADVKVNMCLAGLIYFGPVLPLLMCVLPRHLYLAVEITFDIVELSFSAYLSASYGFKSTGRQVTIAVMNFLSTTLDVLVIKGPEALDDFFSLGDVSNTFFMAYVDALAPDIEDAVTEDAQGHLLPVQYPHRFKEGDRILVGKDGDHKTVKEVKDRALLLEEALPEKIPKMTLVRVCEE